MTVDVNTSRLEIVLNIEGREEPLSFSFPTNTQNVYFQITNADKEIRNAFEYYEKTVKKEGATATDKARAFVQYFEQLGRIYARTLLDAVDISGKETFHEYMNSLPVKTLRDMYVALQKAAVENIAKDFMSGKEGAENDE